MGLECIWAPRRLWGRLCLQITESHVCPAEAPAQYLSALSVGLQDQEGGVTQGGPVLKVGAVPFLGRRSQQRWSVVNQGWGFGEE